MKKNKDSLKAGVLVGTVLAGTAFLGACGHQDRPAPADPVEESDPADKENRQSNGWFEFDPEDNDPEEVYGPPPEPDKRENGSDGEESSDLPDLDPSRNDPEPVYGPPPEPEVER